jgi:hypothetical protein
MKETRVKKQGTTFCSFVRKEGSKPVGSLPIGRNAHGMTFPSANERREKP